MIAKACRSRLNRWRAALSAHPVRMTFSATWRVTGAVCSANHTSPIPPSPSLRTKWYGPIHVAFVLRTEAELAASVVPKVASGSGTCGSLLVLGCEFGGTAPPSCEFTALIGTSTGGGRKTLRVYHGAI